MRKSSASALVLAAAAATTLAVTTPAFAATWTVSSGGTISGTLKSGTSAVLKDTTTSQSVTCTVATAGGSIPNGTGLPPTGIGSITSANFGTAATKCSGPLGSTFTSVIKAGSTWKINAGTYNATTGVTTGTITGVDEVVTGSSLFGACNSEVKGSANTVSYTNSTGVLQVSADPTPALTLSNVTGSGCVGLINNGDKATLTASFVITPKVKITSP